jgi:hypothetical protein
MIVLERQIQQVRQGKWAELEEIDKKFNAVEGRLGFPAKKRYQCIAGSHDVNTLIVERQWESLAAAEAAYEKALADPEHQQLMQGLEALIKSAQRELYTPLP